MYEIRESVELEAGSDEAGWIRNAADLRTAWNATCGSGAFAFSSVAAEANLRWHCRALLSFAFRAIDTIGRLRGEAAEDKT